MKKSQKQSALEQRLLKMLDGKAQQTAKMIFDDPEIQIMHDYANVVSIRRLGFNDHGPVHMRVAALNAMKMFKLLESASIKFNLEKEGIGTVEDSRVAVLMASLFHDFGMTVARNSHEQLSVILAMPITERLLKELYPGDLTQQVIMRSLVAEGILGHMATTKIHTLEAGLVLIGDGCDMEKGRARIPQLIRNEPRVGDIHRYSAGAIQNVKITKGKEKPIRIMIEMTQSVGFFQVEEVLLTKIASSPVKPYIELFAGVNDNEPLQYL